MELLLLFSFIFSFSFFFSVVKVLSTSFIGVLVLSTTSSAVSIVTIVLFDTSAAQDTPTKSKVNINSKNIFSASFFSLSLQITSSYLYIREGGGKYLNIIIKFKLKKIN